MTPLQHLYDFVDPSHERDPGSDEFALTSRTHVWWFYGNMATDLFCCADVSWENAFCFCVYVCSL